MKAQWHWTTKGNSPEGSLFCSGITHRFFSGVNIGQEDPEKLFGVYVKLDQALDGVKHLRFSKEGEAVVAFQAKKKGYTRVGEPLELPDWAGLKDYA